MRHPDDRRSVRLALCAAFLVGAVYRLAAEEPIILRPKTAYYHLGGSWSFLRAESGIATLAGVQGLAFAIQEEDEPGLGFGRAPTWARFLVRGLLPWLIVWASNPRVGPHPGLTPSFSADPHVQEVIERPAPILLLA